MTVRSRSKGRYLKRFFKAFRQIRSRPLNRDPTGDVSYAFYNVNRGDQIRSVHSKIGGLKLNRNGSPLRVHLDR